MGRKKSYDIILRFDDGFMFEFERDEILSTLFQDVKGRVSNYFYGEFKLDAGKRKVKNASNQEGLKLRDKLYDYKNIISIVLLTDNDNGSQDVCEYLVARNIEEGKNTLQNTYVEDDVLCIEIGVDPYANY